MNIPGLPHPRVADRDEASARAEKSGRRFDELQKRITQDRAAFFEKFALLNGGALALSVSILTYVSARHPGAIRFSLVLHVSWGLLLVGLLSSVFRNIVHQHYILHQGFSWYARDIAKLKQAEVRLLRAEPVRLVDDNYETADPIEYAKEIEQNHQTWEKHSTDSSKKARTYENLFIGLEFAAQTGFCLGLIAMVFFAVANVP
jgi:hypothetical protein